MLCPHNALNTIETESRSPLQRKLRALVVDDAPAMLELTCSVLEILGWVEVVGRARDGLEAVQAAAELRPDLVVMDVRMPVMDGLQAARLLAEHFPETRTVLMSGELSPEVGEQCRASGADAFIFKLDFPGEFEPVLRRLFPDPRPRPMA